MGDPINITNDSLSWRREGSYHEPTPRHISRSCSPQSGSTKCTRASSPSINDNDQNSDVINGATHEHDGFLSTALTIIESLRSRLPYLSQSAGVLASTVRTKLFHGGLVDDKQYEIEAAIQLVASLPPHSKRRKDLTRSLLKPLWDDLRHPPLSYLGEEHRYRQADGSNNNIMYPSLGAAGSFYARAVTPHTLPLAVLPDAGLIFDTVFDRGKQFREHPNQISSVLFYMATIITHDIFRTDESNHNKLKNSSYLDLSPLYGNSRDPNSDACIDKVRTFRDGMLKPDTFSEYRVYALPPGVAVLLICFNRFHNYIASQLKEINEGGRFDPRPSPGQSSEAANQQVDEDLFQTARLITCGLYVNIILHDYVRTILNLQSGTHETTWTLDPRADSEDVFDQHEIPSGIGNSCSVEFNLVYRWHSSISERDTRWIEALDKDIHDNRKAHRHSEDLARIDTKFHDHLKEIREQDPSIRQLRGLHRNDKGRYEDQDLVNVMTGSTKDVAGAFGSKNVPTVMKIVEVMGIEQARKWKVCTLNEFRKSFKLMPHRTFADITKNVEVANTLATLYTEPDYVELYPGLIAEDAKESYEPASGLCPGFTTSRTILADAVALIRGDRFYTVDHSPADLTNWGWNQVRSDPDVAAGGVIYNLLMRAMPSYYKGNSVYAMFPFVHPDRTLRVLKKLGKQANYDFEKPRFTPSPTSVTSHEAVTAILQNQDDFKVPWGPHIRDITGHDYMLSGDEKRHRKQRDTMERDIFEPVDWQHKIRDYYHHITRRLIKSHSRSLGEYGDQLDIVKHIGNTSHTLFIAQMFSIPVEEPSDGLFGANVNELYNVDELYDALAVLFAYVFLDGDPAKSFKLGLSAKEAAQKMHRVVGPVVESVKFGKFFPLNHLFNKEGSATLESSYGKHMIERLIQSGQSSEQIVGDIIPTAAAAVATQAQAMAQMLDLYLEDRHSHHWKAIRRCAYSNTEEDFEMLKRYALEGCRLAPAATAVLRKADKGGSQADGERTIEYKSGDMLHLDFFSASRDEQKFSSDANEVNVNRELGSYIHHGVGPHICLGREITQISLAVQLGLFAKLKNLRRLPGQAGRLKYTTKSPEGKPSNTRVYMTEDQRSWWPFPTTMKVQHEGFCETLEEHNPA